MNHQTSDTPETNKFRASLDGMREINQRDRLLSHARKLERERDEAREKLAEVTEEEKTLRYGLRTLSENAAEKRIEVSGRLDRALNERDEARAMVRDMRNQLEKSSTARLILPWENDQIHPRRP